MANMRWVTVDEQGIEVQVRSGTGVVLAVEGINQLPGTLDEFERFRAAIQVDPPRDQPVAIRYTLWPVIDPVTQPELLNAVIDACTNNQPIHWEIEWRRHDDVPADIPINALDFGQDVWSRLVQASRIEPATTVA